MSLVIVSHRELKMKADHHPDGTTCYVDLRDTHGGLVTVNLTYGQASALSAALEQLCQDRGVAAAEGKAILWDKGERVHQSDLALLKNRAFVDDDGIALVDIPSDAFRDHPASKPIAVAGREIGREYCERYGFRYSPCHNAKCGLPEGHDEECTEF